jgi:hypothetical protein
LSDPQKGTYETRNASGQNLRLVAQLGGGLECRVVEGQVEPVVQGWLPADGPSRGVRPIPCVICQREGKRAEFLTVFQPLKTGNAAGIGEAAFRNGAVEIMWTDSRKTMLAWPK